MARKFKSFETRDKPRKRGARKHKKQCIFLQIGTSALGFGKVAQAGLASGFAQANGKQWGVLE